MLAQPSREHPHPPGHTLSQPPFRRAYGAVGRVLDENGGSVGKEGTVALFERRARVGDREVAYRDRRGPVRRVLGAVTSFIGWVVLAVIALIVLVILIF
jgi:hypothetical protein